MTTKRSSGSRRHDWLAVWIIAGIIFLGGSAFSIFKLAALGYNALDLGIFHQVVANTARGDLFAMSIHPHSYFGDHVSPFLMVLVPFYLLVPRPETLLVLQAAAIALAVFPLALLVRSLRFSLRLAVLLAYALSPLVHSFIAFEFELLVFSLPFLFAALYAYEQRRYRLFLLWSVLAAMVREDAGLLLIGFGILSAFDHRPLRWKFLPPLIGFLVFFGGMMISAGVNHEQYKFLAYYSWAGSSATQAISYLFTHPWMFFAKLLRLQNILFAAMLFLLFAGIPLLRPRRLLPLVFVAAALLLTNVGGDGITLRTHYPALLVPFFFWALIGGFERIETKPPLRLQRFFGSSTIVVMSLLLLVVSLYGCVTMSPFRPKAIREIATDLRDPKTKVAQSLIASIPREAHIASSYAQLPFFGQHASLSSMNYVFSGKRQFSPLSYVLPDETDTILYDSADYRLYSIQYAHDEEKFQKGDDRLRALFTERGFGIKEVIDSYLLLQRGSVAGLSSLYSIGTTIGRPAPRNRANPLSLITIDGQEEALRASAWTNRETTVETLPISLTWRTQERTDRTYHLRVEYTDEKQHVRSSRVYALGYGLFPTTEWPADTPVTIRYRFLIPRLPTGSYSVWIRAESEEGYLTLDAKLSAAVERTSQTFGSERILIGTITL